jgi:diguanylate cyclase (GGDEF)-like protein/PAS domain S-box-containing protein
MSHRSAAPEHRSTYASRSRADLLACLLASTALSALAHATGAFEHLVSFTQRHQRYPLGDMVAASVVLAVALGVFAYRRCMDLAAAAQRQKAALQQLGESERRFSAAFRGSPHAQLVASLREGLVLEANDAFLELTEAAPGSVIRCRLEALELWGSPDFMASLPQLIRRTRSVSNLETTVCTPLGVQREVLVSAGLIEVDGVRCILMGFNDISARKQAERQLSHQAFHDGLTGLPNRALFRDRVEHAMHRSTRTGVAPAVMFLDLDSFKWINDSFGHQVGDDLLRQVRDRLLVCLRDSDTCARLGGDEFGVLIEDAADHAALVRVAERMLQAVRTRFVLPGIDTCTTASIGIARAEPGMDMDALLRSADLAMYMAKGSGKGRFAMYEPAMHQAALARTALESDMHGGLERGEFVVHYQPIIHFSSRAILAFEALVRWQHPTRGLLAPSEFIPMAEENGSILELGRWVLRTACGECARWQKEFPRARPVSVWVNLSGRQIAHPGLVREVTAALDESGLAPESLVVELTETVLVMNDRAAADRLWELNELGVQLAVDDFGNGYSSLACLQGFPVDILKVDRSFTASMGDGSAESPISRAVFAMGRTLELQTVAQGIETEAQWKRLEELGCELGQGYLLGRPVGSEEAEALLRDEPAASQAEPARIRRTRSWRRSRPDAAPAALVV